MSKYRGATYRLGKCRRYVCPECGSINMRPLRAEDTIARPFPVPCLLCFHSLEDCEFTIEDSSKWLGRWLGDEADGATD